MVIIYNQIKKTQHRKGYTMARLTVNNIKFVKLRVVEGALYGVYVAVKGNDSRDYSIYDAKGRTTDDVTPEQSVELLESLPKSVKTFMDAHSADVFSVDEWGDKQYVVFIYR